VAGSPLEVERAARRQLYGNRPAVGVTPRLGRPLGAREGRPTAGEAIHILAQVAEALTYVHDLGVVHQDVSPHNILITSRDATVKLADFGLASDSLDRPARQETGGTPGYIAPEVLRGAPPSPQSDLYSLGVVAHRLLTGSAPARPLVVERPGLPRALSEAIERAVDDCPNARQASVAEFRAELIDALGTPLRQLSSVA
jgi:eukaryotic-like serine/threonine-protein kinase